MSGRPPDPETDRPGVLGGTFDPVHLGHLHAAEQVLAVFRLPRVLLVPSFIPPHKIRPDLTATEHRLAMLSLAVEGHDGLEVCTLEIERGGVSYTVDTLRALARNRPPCRPIFILGIDALYEIGLWHEHEALVDEFDLVAVDRPGERLELSQGSLGGALTRRIVSVPCEPGGGVVRGSSPPGCGGRIFHLPIHPIPVSSSRVRALAAAGETLDGLVPPAVARYIQEHRVYRQEGSP